MKRQLVKHLPIFRTNPKPSNTYIEPIDRHQGAVSMSRQLDDTQSYYYGSLLSNVLNAEAEEQHFPDERLEEPIVNDWLRGIRIRFWHFEAVTLVRHMKPPYLY